MSHEISNAHDNGVEVAPEQPQEKNPFVVIDEKKRTHVQKRCDQCAMCGRVDVVESGTYATTLGYKNDVTDEKYWFCCQLHLNMYKHKAGMGQMPKEIYDKEMISIKRYLKKRQAKE